MKSELFKSVTKNKKKRKRKNLFLVIFNRNLIEFAQKNWNGYFSIAIITSHTMSITSSEAPRASTETLQASMILMMRHGKSTTHSHDGKTKTKFRQVIEVTLKDGSKYIINTTAEILDLQLHMKQMERCVII